MSPMVVVTLVHGTFARGAEWTQLDSKFSIDLLHNLRCRAVVTRFDWSGRNNLWDRAKAAEELSDFVDALRAIYPDAKQYVVAHSHGGNVALYAARRTRIDGIACLATPFLHAIHRDRLLFSERAVVGGLMGLALLASYIFNLASGLSFFEWCGVLVILGLICTFAAVIISHLGDIGTKRVAELADGLNVCIPKNTQIGVFRVTGDEASASLASGQLLAWASVRLTTYFAKANDLRFLREPFRNLPVPTAFWLIPLVGILASAGAKYFAAPGLSIIGGVAVSVSVLVLVGLKTTFFDNLLYGFFFLMLLVAILVVTAVQGTVPSREMFEELDVRWNERIAIWVARWSMGLGSSLALEITTEAIPVGASATIHLFSRDTRGSNADQLAHSVYENADVRSAVVRWIDEHVSAGIEERLG